MEDLNKKHDYAQDFEVITMLKPNLYNLDLFEKIFHGMLDFDMSYEAQSFPPINMYLDEETKDVYFEMALAGYDKDKINVSFEDDKMLVTGEIDKKEKEEKRILKRGIKYSNFKNYFTIPFTKYDIEKAKAEFKDGLLKVFVPAKETYSQKITIE
jgi:HSP20 family molecular chaperone IbpA